MMKKIFLTDIGLFTIVTYFIPLRKNQSLLYWNYIEKEINSTSEERRIGG